MQAFLDKIDIGQMIAVLFCVILAGSASKVTAQIQPCEETGKGNVNIASNSEDIKPVKIVTIPEALYPEPARDAGVSGTVSLKVRFLAGGRIGWVNVVSGPEELTYEATRAARKIRFIPARQNGKMIHVEEIVEYRFSDPRKCRPETVSAN